MEGRVLYSSDWGQTQIAVMKPQAAGN